MNRYLIVASIVLSAFVHTHALVINEILSNPIGDDSGREWIELYNDEENNVDLSTLTISIKGGTPIAALFLSGNQVLQPHSYAITASTVGGVTRFSQDYPAYNGPLFKSAISLVNTGITSIDIRLRGVIVDTLSSYTAAKEGSTYARSNGTWIVGTPTPGEENKQATSTTDTPPISTDPLGGQTTIAQASPPVSDIVFLLPKERIIVAGAPSLFSVYSTNHEGKLLDGISYTWSFGDGGEKFGATTTYRYVYPGTYVAQVEGSNGAVSGIGRTKVRVVAPEMTLSSLLFGKYGSYVELYNPNMYDLDISNWKLSIDGAVFPFPKNTLLGSGVTRFTGVAMGFASTTVSSSTLLKILFPTMEEVLRIYQGEDGTSLSLASSTEIVASSSSFLQKAHKQTYATYVPQKGKEVVVLPKDKVDVAATATVKMMPKTTKKDSRIASFFRGLF
jgi:hypothetical protein